MDKASVILLHRLDSPVGVIGTFDCKGYETLCIDLVQGGAVAGTTITVAWLGPGGAGFITEVYTLNPPLRAQENLRLPVRGERVTITITLAVGAAVISPIDIYLDPLKIDAGAHRIRRSYVVPILGGAIATVFSGFQHGIIMRASGDLLLGPTVAAAVWPLAAGEILTYAFKNQLVIVNPNVGAINVYITETEE